METADDTVREQTNQSEWSNPENWSGPKWLQIYTSKRDTRAWVPKRHPALGWTVNLGHRTGAVWLLIAVAGALAFVVISNIVILNLILKK